MADPIAGRQGKTSISCKRFQTIIPHKTYRTGDTYGCYCYYWRETSVPWVLSIDNSGLVVGRNSGSLAPPSIIDTICINKTNFHKSLIVCLLAMNGFSNNFLS